MHNMALGNVGEKKYHRHHILYKWSQIQSPELFTCNNQWDRLTFSAVFTVSILDIENDLAFYEHKQRPT